MFCITSAAQPSFFTELANKSDQNEKNERSNGSGDKSNLSAKRQNGILQDEKQTHCPICSEKFEVVFDPDNDEWIYKGTMLDNSAKIVHKQCYEVQMSPRQSNKKTENEHENENENSENEVKGENNSNRPPSENDQVDNKNPEIAANIENKPPTEEAKQQQQEVVIGSKRTHEEATNDLPELEKIPSDDEVSKRQKLS